MVGKSRSEAWLQRQVMSVMICRQVLNQGEMPRLTPSDLGTRITVTVLLVFMSLFISTDNRSVPTTTRTLTAGACCVSDRPAKTGRRTGRLTLESSHRRLDPLVTVPLLLDPLSRGVHDPSRLPAVDSCSINFSLCSVRDALHEQLVMRLVDSR